MWHEARRQEKKIRGMMVDYRRRAERRRDFYEKFKADPTQFLQLHGRPCKIYMDAAVAAAGDGPTAMMPWQGRPDLMIDRFDVRAHMDIIREPPPPEPDPEPSQEDRFLNYERYRILVQNEYLGVEEEKFLHQIYLEEQFGPIALKQGDTVEKERDKRKKGAAIAYTYDDSVAESSTVPGVDPLNPDDSDSEEDSELDFDLCLDLSEVDTASAHELNSFGQAFGLVGNDFYSYLTNDVDEQDTMRMAKEQEEEKAMFSGRKARRERQAFREKRLMGRVMSPPSYAARESPVYDKYNKKSKSKSRSVSPDVAGGGIGGAVTYITSFGEEDASTVAVPAVALPKPLSQRSRSKERGLSPCRRSRSASYNGSRRRSRSLSYRGARRSSSLDSRRRRWTRSRTRSRSRGRRTRSRSRSRSRRRSRSRSYSQSRSRSRRKSLPRRRGSRSRSYSRRKSTRSRSRSRKRFSRSASPRSNTNGSVQEKAETKPVVPRYYGRNRKDSSSSLDMSSDDDTASSSAPASTTKVSESKRGRAVVGGRGRADSRAANKPRENPKEKLKRRMQALLNKQFKEDKRLEQQKAVQAERERQDRAAELRDIAIKIRRRERELRHQDDEENGSRSTSKSPSKTVVKSPKKSPQRVWSPRFSPRHRSRTRSRSPKFARRSRSPRRSWSPRRSRSPRRRSPSPRRRSPRWSRSPRRRRSQSPRRSPRRRSPSPRSPRRRSPSPRGARNRRSPTPRRSRSPRPDEWRNDSGRYSPPRRSLVDY